MRARRATPSDLVVAKSALTDTIYAGRISKDGKRWVGKKHDVTSHALKAVIDLVTPGHSMDITSEGKTLYRIVVEVIDSHGQDEKNR